MSSDSQSEYIGLDSHMKHRVPELTGTYMSYLTSGEVTKLSIWVDEFNSRIRHLRPKPIFAEIVHSTCILHRIRLLG